MGRFSWRCDHYLTQTWKEQYDRCKQNRVLSWECQNINKGLSMHGGGVTGVELSWELGVVTDSRCSKPPVDPELTFDCCHFYSGVRFNRLGIGGRAGCWSSVLGYWRCCRWWDVWRQRRWRYCSWWVGSRDYYLFRIQENAQWMKTWVQDVNMCHSDEFNLVWANKCI